MKDMQVGSELDSYCGRCKLELRHVVVAMVDGLPKRVRCLTCENEHNHRLPRKKTTSTRRKTKKTSSRKAQEAAAQWASVMAEWDDERARKYSVFGSFQVNDYLLHSSFGKGVVVEVPGPDRIITLFENGEKLLLQGRNRG